MGKSNVFLFPIYTRLIKNIKSPTALLGFTVKSDFLTNDNEYVMYDMNLNN